ncbi:MAG: hypothetical protein ACR2NI_10610 [Pirellulales bacterium]
MEKVIQTFTASMSTETISVQINGETTDQLQKVVISNTESGEIVSSQTIRNTVPTSEAWAVIQAASGK